MGKTVKLQAGPSLHTKVEQWDDSQQKAVRLTISWPDGDEDSALASPDEAFRFALAILRDVSLAKCGAG